MTTFRPISIVALALLTLGCARDGALDIEPIEGDGCVTLMVFDPTQTCADVNLGRLPEQTPRFASTSCFPDTAFAELDLPKEPLTLVAVQRPTRDSCAATAVACARVSPGEDADLTLRPVTVCEPGCAEGPCAADGGVDAGVDAGSDGGVDSGITGNDCCAIADDPDDCDGDGLANDLERGPGGERINTDMTIAGDHPAGVVAADELFDDCDLDSDGDGLSDALECTASPEACGDAPSAPPYRDPDQDGDDVPDGLECCGLVIERSGCDLDGDGDPAHRDVDSDGDGIEDADECVYAGHALDDCDTDGDSVCNALDLDSDQDGAYDDEECQNPRNRAECQEPYLHTQVRCGGELDPAGYCGRCGRTCDAALACHEPSSTVAYCSSNARERPRWSLTGSSEFPVPPPNTTGTLVLRPLHHTDPERVAAAPADREYTIMYHSTAPSTDPVPVEGNLVAELASSSSSACLPLADGDTGRVPECIAVYGVFLRDTTGGETRCGAAASVLVVASDSGRVATAAIPGRVTFYDFFDTDGQREAIDGFDRGFVVLEAPDASGAPWQVVPGGVIALARPTEDCDSIAFDFASL